MCVTKHTTIPYTMSFATTLSDVRQHSLTLMISPTWMTCPSMLMRLMKSKRRLQRASLICRCASVLSYRLSFTIYGSGVLIKLKLSLSTALSYSFDAFHKRLYAISLAMSTALDSCSSGTDAIGMSLYLHPSSMALRTLVSRFLLFSSQYVLDDIIVSHLLVHAVFPICMMIHLLRIFLPAIDYAVDFQPKNHILL